MLIFFSLNFDCFMNYTSCAIKYFFKHIGILLTLMIFLLYNSSVQKLGINTEDPKDLNMISDISTSNIYSIIGKNGINYETYITENINNNNDSNGNNSNDKNSNNNDNKNNGNSSNNKNKNNIYDQTNSLIKIKKDYIIKNNELAYIKKLNKNILYLHSISIEYILSYTFSFIILIILMILNSFSEAKLIQEGNGNWRYQCPLDKLDLILNIIEFIIIVYLTRISINTWNYSYVFKCTKYINYSIIIYITMGPLINVIIIINYNN